MSTCPPLTVAADVASQRLSADGARAVSGGYDRTVRVWDLAAGQQLAVLTGRDGTVYAVAVSADGARAVSGGYDRTVRVWDLAADQQLAELTGHESWMRSAAVTADGARAVTGGKRCRRAVSPSKADRLEARLLRGNDVVLRVPHMDRPRPQPAVLAGLDRFVRDTGPDLRDARRDAAGGAAVRERQGRRARERATLHLVRLDLGEPFVR